MFLYIYLIEHLNLFIILLVLFHGVEMKLVQKDYHVGEVKIL